MIKSNMFPDQTKVIYPQNCFFADDFEFYIMDCESAKNIALSLIVSKYQLGKDAKNQILSVFDEFDTNTLQLNNALSQ